MSLVAVGVVLFSLGLLLRPTDGFTSVRNWPKQSLKVKPLIEQTAKRHAIPIPIFAAWIANESSFRAGVYNPELNAMQRWSCSIADDPRWKDNPDYDSAVEICNRLAQGEDPTELAPLWKFGSFGLGQVTAIIARSVGYPYEASNDGLFDPKTNLELTGRDISRLREKLFPGRTSLSLPEWSVIRAAYVGGPGLLDRNPVKASEIAQRLIDTYTNLTA